MEQILGAKELNKSKVSKDIYNIYNSQWVDWEIFVEEKEKRYC